ncbi:hypothetical protein BFP72_18405 [Reichenbachiella sp. 5M10]|uniref:hypothetical protein n=1 Tax=Reichenbachiella sp. 5M10 TaxID=1889772 RepID=UPI000C154A02|nr:hypothetical protein [Reichenbachiella sp. 5M10]PIB37238.1 hypothetical protein BFP72_18405 [Reichenbachiella sp. 5M10]
MHGSKLNQQAKQKYITTYSQIILDEFFDKNEGISGQQIISLTPIKQVNFFVLKVLFEEWQEETKKFKSPYFDYKNEEVNTALKTLVNTLSKNIFIQKEDFKSLLERAVSETLEFLYTPDQYLLQETQKATSSELIKELKTTGKYIKLHKGLFDSILINLENGMSTDKPVVESVIKNATESYNEDTAEKEEIENLFNLTSLLDIVEKESPAIVETAQTEEPEINFFDTLEALPEEKTEDTLSVPEPMTPPSSSAFAEEDDEPQKPVEESFEQEFEPESPPTPTPLSSEPEPKNPKKETTVSNLNQKFAGEDILTLNQRYEASEKETIASSHESKPTSELASSISINQRYLFVKDLFEGNEKDFEKALYQMEASKSFDASVELLVQSYAKKYAWDMNSEEVKELLKVIFKRFR